MLNQVFDRVAWRRSHRFPDYEVSDTGLVRRSTSGRSTYRGRVLRAYLDSSGYRAVHIRDAAGSMQSVRIHVLVAEAFLANKRLDQEVNHIDGHKYNNRAENLEWATRSENLRHAYRTGLKEPRDMRGEQNTRARLSQCQASEIRSLAKEGADVWDLSLLYDVSVITIRQVANGRRWSHIG